MSRRRATQLGVGLQREARWLKVARRLDFHVAPAESRPAVSSLRVVQHLPSAFVVNGWSQWLAPGCRLDGGPSLHPVDNRQGLYVLLPE
jgi:hypothetical protein